MNMTMVTAGAPVLKNLARLLPDLETLLISFSYLPPRASPELFHA